MRNVTLRQVRRSAGLYPITSLYLAAVGLAVPVTLGLIHVTVGLGIFAGLAVIAVLVATGRENGPRLQRPKRGRDR